MRKHDVRKWLHAILDLLPVIIIPVFMIYSHRHTIDNYSIEVPQNALVQVKQDITNGNLQYNENTNVLTGWSLEDNVAVLSNVNGYIEVEDSYMAFYNDNINFNINQNDILLFKCYGYSSVDTQTIGIFMYDENEAEFESSITLNSDDFAYTRMTASSSFVSIYQFVLQSDLDEIIYLKNIQCFNLTQMFGSGNEPTIDEFNTYFPNDYYAVDSTAKAFIKNVGTITYDDTDIGSQMLYCLYNSVDKYFNLNNVFGFNNVYDWLSLNIFNGNPPIAIYIVWNIALYEFLMDLIMLLYALFMWFIDMCEHLIDRSFGVASGRKK